MKKINLFLTILACLVLISACKKKFNLPPERAPLSKSGSVTIDSLKRKYASYYQSNPSPTKLFRFSDDATLTCTVTADETSGNIYKAVYVEDASGTMIVKLLNSSGLFVGDLIEINLRNIALDDYGKMIQLDSVDIEKSVTKLSSGHAVTPTKVTFNQIMLTPAALTKYQGKLILLDSVSFAAGDKGQSFADTINKFSLDRILENSAGQQVVVRTSGYANFARNRIPCGKGSLVAVVGEYNGDAQLTIRNFNEVKLTNDNCPVLIKSFDNETIYSKGWTTYNAIGSVNWTIGTYGGRLYGNISNYPSNQTCETWLISPAFDISTAPNPIFNFVSAYNYSGPALQVLVSTNYVSGNPNAAGVTWTNLNPTLSGGSFAWTGSGNISLSSYKTPTTRVAFKYTATGAGSTWEVDDIAVYAQP
jgi:hypothetical protein